MPAVARPRGQEPKADDALLPSAIEDRAALERIAKSPQLSASPRLIAFLRYVVDQTLVGHSAQIKSYTIAVEALGRRPSFDPQNDAIVRVEAGRLRRALARYYTAPGCDDPLLIDLPLGSYVPLFSWRASAAPSDLPLRRDHGGCAGAIGVRGTGRAALQAISHRLIELRLQIDAMVAEIEIATGILERSG